jgi:SRSO17 transposase
LTPRRPSAISATPRAGWSRTCPARRPSPWPCAGVPPRNRQQFLKACLWDHDGRTDAVQRRLLAATTDLPPDPIGTVGVLDETSALKQGKETPGVQRQYLGRVGKVGNGIVTVHLAVANGKFKALLDSELYLPESWDADRKRGRAADIPDAVRYRCLVDILAYHQHRNTATRTSRPKRSRRFTALLC